MTELATEDELLAAIREAGMRVTLARRAICGALAASEDAYLTASEIQERVSERSGDIDSSTIYRTLDEFTRLGLIHHIHVGSNQQGLWHLTMDHSHQDLVCEGCGTTIIVPLEDVAPTHQMLQEKYGFTVKIHHYAIVGHCETCESQVDHPH